MDVCPQTYDASFYLQSSDTSCLTSANVSLRSNATGQIYASSLVALDGLSTTNYTRFQTQVISSVKAPSSNNTFAITFNAEQVAGKTLYFSLISLFPETFKGRRNGLRYDLAQSVYNLKPKFLRFPGGNNLEGQSIAGRWKWNETIGPLTDRPGRVGDWGMSVFLIFP